MKAFIFDLDGIIVDTAKYHFKSWKIISKNFGFELSKTQNERLKGVSREKSLDRILSWGGISIDRFEKKKYLEKKNELYKGFISNLSQMDILPGVIKLLDFAAIKDIPIALGSASKNAHQILKKLGIKDKFKVIIDGNLTSKSKPHPEVFLKGAKMLGVNPKEVIVFEDSIAGVKAANKAKMVSVAICTCGKIENAKYNFNSLDDIPLEFFEKMI
ncbi:beta-phosphoglucomutase [bacterium]|nr:beta-phosphoglucomutase [Bacteroidota bacterium]MDC3064193.1 beta-phosphoglucomutase [bacterium]